MSIKDVGKKSNPPKALPNEEEFDIVSVDSVAQNKAGLRENLLYVGILVLVGGISFGIGKLVTYSNGAATVTATHVEESNMQVASPKVVTAEVSSPVILEPKKTVPASIATPKIQPHTDAETPTLTSGPIVASKNGSKYYLATCSGAKRISDANKVYFANEQDAKQAGLTPSSTCKGLK